MIIKSKMLCFRSQLLSKFFFLIVSLDCIAVEILESNNDEVMLTTACKNIFFNTKQYVDVSKIKLGCRNIEDVETDGYENCVFTYRRLEFELKCRILSNEIKRIAPGIILMQKQMKRNEHSEYNISN